MEARAPLLLAAVSASLAMSAQTLDQANNAAVPGQYFTFHQTNNVPPGSGGANQVWDFSNMPSGAPVFFNHQLPSGTPYGFMFPGASVAVLDIHNDIRYLQATASGIDFLGQYASVINSVIVYQDPERLMSYPCSYGTSWTDAFSSNFSSSGTPVVRSGSISGLADGYGTLITPFGTYGNVLRVRTIEDYTDIVGGFITIDYLFTHYAWYLPGTPVPLVSVHDQLTVTNGSPSSSLYARWLTSSPLGITVGEQVDLTVAVYPNPATDRIEVVFGSAGGLHLVELVDATGRVVRTEGHPGQPVGIARIATEVATLPAGLYHVRVRNASGEQGVGRFVVE